MTRFQEATKVIGKSLLYRFWTPHLPRPLRLGYVFHTECIYDDTYFKVLLKFCEDYFQLTQNRPICTLMSPRAVRVAQQLKIRGIKERDYTERARLLSGVSTIGYHGHFWMDPNQLGGPENEMRGDRFSISALNEQISRDLDWFKKSDVDHHGIYSAGWWVMRQEIMESLIINGFSLDFSFSKSPWFKNKFSMELMEKNKIRSGEPFFTEGSTGRTLCVQDFLGCHTTPFPQDFIRNINLQFSKDEELYSSPTGVVHSHDYDLSPLNTLRCLQWLKTRCDVTFLSAEDFQAMKTYPLRSISLAR